MRMWLLLAVAYIAACSSDEPPADAGALLFVTNEISGDISIIDPVMRREVQRVAVGKRPRGIVASPDGRLLYIALSGSPIAGPGVDESTLPAADKSADGIAVFDVASRRVLRVIRGVSDPETVAVSPDGSRLYVASEDTGQLVILDAASGGIRATLPVGGEPEGTAVSPDGSLVYVTSEEDHVAAVVETSGPSVRARVPVGKRPRNSAFTLDGAIAYVPGENDATVTMIDVRSDQPIRSAVIPGEQVRPMGILLARDGKALYVTTGRGGELVRLHSKTLEVTGRVNVGERPWGLAASPDGRFLFTANGPSGDVTMVDAAAMQVIARIPAGDRPWGVATITAI